jgi:DNA-binding transcriptional MocR family regulator
MARPAALYVQLAEEIRRMIEGGMFKPGERLPSVRALSRAKQVSIPTATACYQYLEDQGLVRVRPQSGYFVAASGQPAGPGVPALARTADYAHIIERTLDGEHSTQYDTAVQDDAFFPVHRLSLIMAELLRHDPGMLGRSTLALGDPGLRGQIARRLINWNCLIDPEELVITNGGLEAINLCLRALTRPGDTVVVESPAYYGFLNLIDTCGLKLVEIPCSPTRGMDLDVLRQVLALQPVKACLMSTSVSNPLGVTMALDAKRRLLAELADRGIPLIEDATFADLHYAGPTPAAQSLDPEGNVILCASLTKTLAPGFRLGWVHPGRFMKPVRSLKRILSGDQPEILQRTLAIYLENGGYERHLRKARHELKARLAATLESVQRHFPEGSRWTEPSGGFLLWVELARAFDVDFLQGCALNLGLRIAPGRIFSASGQFERHLRLNFAQADTGRLSASLERFGKEIRSHLRATVGSQTQY